MVLLSLVYPERLQSLLGLGIETILTGSIFCGPLPLQCSLGLVVITVLILLVKKFVYFQIQLLHPENSIYLHKS